MPENSRMFRGFVVKSFEEIAINNPGSHRHKDWSSLVEKHVNRINIRLLGIHYYVTTPIRQHCWLPQFFQENSGA